MAIDSNELAIDFSKCAFKPERENLAKFLTSYLIGKKQGGYVLNVNGDWGSGKTFFTKSWLDNIHSSHPAIYIDAWRTDFSSDPIIVVVKQLIDELKDLNKESGINSELESKVLKSLYKLTSSSAKVISSGVAAYLGLGAGTGKDAANLLLSKLDEIVEGAGEIDYANYQLNYDAMDEFKKAISNLLDSHLTSSQKEGPMFIFIDELDRCRPSYAVEMLEAVKHLFGIENIVFVVSTNTVELCHSVSAIYGNGFSSEQYLERFFDRTIILPAPSIQKYIEASYGKFLNQIDTTKKISLPSGVKPIHVITALLLAEDYQLRDIDKFMDVLSGSINWAQDKSKNSNEFDFINLAVLIVYKKKYPEIFSSIVYEKKFKNRNTPNQNLELARYKPNFYPYLYNTSISNQLEFEDQLLRLSANKIHPADISNMYLNKQTNNSEPALFKQLAELYSNRFRLRDSTKLVTFKELAEIVNMATILDK